MTTGSQGSPKKQPARQVKAEDMQKLSDKRVIEWSQAEVNCWLRFKGFDSYADLLTNEHHVDGATLILLSEADFRSPPLSLKVLRDIKQLSAAIEELRSQPPKTLSVKSAPNLSRLTPGAIDPVVVEQLDLSEFPVANGQLTTAATAQAIAGRQLSKDEIDEIISKVESPDTPTKSFVKTVIAACYCLTAMLVTAFVMVIVHDRVPDMKTYPPLPDLFLDNVPLIPWAFEMCELIACVMGSIWTLVVVFHANRMILLRRMFSLAGTVFLLRCITMLITSMSVPGIHLECSARPYGDLQAKLRQAFRIWFGMGLSLRGVRSCGDYMFSGHTVALTMLNHFVTEYTPDTWFGLHTATWLMNLFGVFFILAGHEHYSIDVFIAFFISSRLFLYYHSMAYAAPHLPATDRRTRMWFPLFWFFESGGKLGRVPNHFEWPLPSPSVVVSRVRTFVTGGKHFILAEIEKRQGSPNSTRKAKTPLRFDLNSFPKEKRHSAKSKVKLT